MKICLILFSFVLIAFGLVASYLSFGLCYLLICFAVESLLDSTFHWLSQSLFGLIACLILWQTLKGTLPEIDNLKWDSATSEDGKSTLNWQGMGGRLWNVNPLGADSARSGSQLIIAVLSFGPNLILHSFLACWSILKR